MADENESRGRLRDRIGSAREGVRSSVDRLSGAEFRREFEQFTEAVTTAIVGLHGDATEMRGKMELIERQRNSAEEARKPGRLTLVALVVSMLAVLLAVASFVLAFTL